MAVVVPSYSAGHFIWVAGVSVAFVWRQDWSWLSRIALGAGLATMEVAHGGLFLPV